MLTVGIHLIWTTYLTWPPGDPRGHWSPLFDLYGHLTATGHRLNLPDPETYRQSLERAKEPPKILDAVEQRLVATASAETLTFTGVSRVYAAAIEPTHVHLLIGPTTTPISKLAGMLKSKSSSAVIAHGREVDRERTWTTGFWKVFLFDNEALAAVQDYVLDHNVRAGRCRNPHDWVRPL